MRIIGIRRESNYSPNMAGNDAAIFTAVMDELKAMGHEVIFIDENEVVDMDFRAYDRVVTMARDIKSLAILRERNVEKQTLFINSVEGILTCSDKAAVANMMQELGIPQPAFIPPQNEPLPISEKGVGNIPFPLWLKKCDGCAEYSLDTSFCPTKRDLENAVRRMRSIGYQHWMVQAHQKGDLVKFYGVEGTEFFHWQYASRGHSKFGLEEINGKERGYTFDATRIKEYADQLA